MQQVVERPEGVYLTQINANSTQNLHTQQSPRARQPSFRRFDPTAEQESNDSKPSSVSPESTLKQKAGTEYTLFDNVLQQQA